ncbi:ExbD/TolR family protein [Marinobacter alexandrii]|uniref:ExbD/TolR family protein n=1 Tax=Marinobacter alexandrii TaxID=2570351 RepID=UPI003299969C
MSQTRLPEVRRAKTIDSSLAIVNIVLLLIFFFLATGTLIASDSVEIDLPETTQLPLDLLPKPLLTVDGDTSMTLDGVPIEPGTLAPLLLDYPTLHVLADRELGAGTLLDLLEAEELVAVNVKLVTLHGKAPDEGQP